MLPTHEHSAYYYTTTTVQGSMSHDITTDTKGYYVYRGRNNGSNTYICPAVCVPKGSTIINSRSQAKHPCSLDLPSQAKFESPQLSQKQLRTVNDFTGLPGLPCEYVSIGLTLNQVVFFPRMSGLSLGVGQPGYRARFIVGFRPLRETPLA